MNKRMYFVYIMANFNNTTLYIGFTNNLARRIKEHKEQVNDGFSKTYRTKKVVYYEVLDEPENAIRREKQMKGKSRRYKETLINSVNPQWKDLSQEVIRYQAGA